MLDWPTDQPGTLAHITTRYRHFAEHEARGVSPLYTALAQRVAASEPLLRFVAALPPGKQQPNLVFAAVRHLYGTPADADQFERLVAQHPAPIRALILRRSTQTNEPARCATLLPVLAQLQQPLALLEVGASAGLCLLPDHWGYDYGRVQVAPRVRAGHPAPIFPCEASATTPLPTSMPEIVWRAGLDLNPLSVTDPEDVAWLRTLVWPEQEERAVRLGAAIAVAQQQPPGVRQGNLVVDLPALAAEAPADASLVIFHSAVLAYVTEQDRARFRDVVAGLKAVWISNEGPAVLPEIAAKLGGTPPTDRFLLAVDGEPVALTAPHGQAIDWLS